MSTSAELTPSSSSFSDGSGSSSGRPAADAGDDGNIVQIYAGQLFDSEERRLLARRVLSVSRASGLIVDMRTYEEEEAQRVFGGIGGEDGEAGRGTVDLRRETVLPGLVDAHVHFFLHPYAETSWEDQVTKESLVERTVRATVHAKRTLLAGYTTVRDLGTEGAEDADIGLRKCLSGAHPLIPGPRYFCATRALVPTGSYGPKSSLRVGQEGVDGITGAEVVDGVDECVKAVRRQIGAGADWIKVRLHYRFRSRTADVAPLRSKGDFALFTKPELEAILATAHGLGVKVAAHATLLSSLHGLAFDSVEHTVEMSTAHGSLSPTTTWVPTLAVYHTLSQGPGGKWERMVKTFKTAVDQGEDRIACGGDTGPFPHGDNALELQLMVSLGADWKDVLWWATLGGWRCVRSMAWEGKAGEARLARVHELGEDVRVVGDNEVPFGVFRKGFAADVIATTGDLENDFKGAIWKDNISFVMKGGKVYKKDGNEIVWV
ncbi:hypothetical protein OF83DRAFT_1053830 [Amylostereum chailletii]|nr:hypothetical protein OF83DRAFT_1053830 [Amylostereum chailletii]